MMSQIILCDATELYNILNQYFRVSRLVEFNYLCLIGKGEIHECSYVLFQKGNARSQEEYNESHIITARKAKWDDEGKFVMPAGVEIESMRYCVVYDSNTSSLQGSGPATDCTGILAKSSRYPELESMKPYPVEILPGQLYMGDYRQATSPQIHKDLKLRAVVNVSEKTNHEAWEHMLKCKSNMRPKRGFVQQLSDWEVHTLGERKTFIAEPHY
ncbi:hypothetical protein Z043_124138 [Scleropages formosus]|uniref:Uncharacterized protein n=1 Tax=Scleropages formosus TaxID=113540 RepID=A0A0P7W607_SCLFO|nr:hypothetical protein Z043_124138 [Scleropages formosus]